MLTFLFIFLFFIQFLHTIAEDTDTDEAWDINFECQPAIKNLATKQAEMVKCSVENNSPSQVCTKCTRQYIQFREQDYRSRHMDKIKSLDGRTCSAVIYNSYGVSYAQEMHAVLVDRIWEHSHCGYCVNIRWNMEYGNSTYELDAKTFKFKSHLSDWRDCVTNVSLPDTMCKSCQKAYDNLFNFYWVIYSDPNIFFCIDVDSEMNDTMKLWSDIWNCTEAPLDRSKDATVLLFSVTILAICIGLFYAGSYIQSEQTQSTLIHYSRLQESQPIGDRFRILSSSTLDSSYLNSTPSSSLQG